MIRPALTWAEIEAMSAGDAAAMWAVRFDGGASAGDQELFERWLNTAPDNSLAWHATQSSWALLDDHEEEPLFAGLLEEARAAAEPKKPKRLWPRYAGVAAALGIGALAWQLPSVLQKYEQVATTGSTAQSVPEFRYVTATGQTRNVTLPDGSKLALDTATIVEGRFTPAARDLHLVAGQAYFDVAHDASHPFRVAFGRQVVTAVGTRFDIRIDPASSRVTLLQGKVVVQAADHPDMKVDLSPGQEVLIDRQGYTRRTVDAEPSAAWRTGNIRFHDTPLPQVLAEMNRYSDHPFVVRDPAVAGLRVSGIFQTAAPMTFLKDIAQLYRLKIAHLQSGAWELKAGGSAP